MTYGDIVTRALRLIGVLYETETPSAEQGADALSQLNAMMAYWETDGVRIGYFSGDSTTETLNLDTRYRVPLEYNLALWLAPQFEREPSPIVATIAVDSYGKLLREAVLANRVESSPVGPRGEAGVGWYDITTL